MGIKDNSGIFIPFGRPKWLIIITFAFAYSALLCHFHASELRENGEIYTALLYWFFGLTALAGAFRFKIAGVIEKLIGKNNE